MSIRVHPRTQPVGITLPEMGSACARIAMEHELTTAEWVHCLAQSPAQTTRYLLREERHPGDPDKRADEA
jgi:hypothetical protein